MKKKSFAVTVINNETRLFNIEAKNEKEARKIIEEADFKEVMKKHESRVINAEFTIDDITENEKEPSSAHGFSIGDQVLVPDPRTTNTWIPKDEWDHEFIGRIDSFRDENTATIVDQINDAFDVEIHLLKKYED